MYEFTLTDAEISMLVLLIVYQLIYHKNCVFILRIVESQTRLKNKNFKPLDKRKNWKIFFSKQLKNFQVCNNFLGFSYFRNQDNVSWQSPPPFLLVYFTSYLVRCKTVCLDFRRHFAGHRQYAKVCWSFERISLVRLSSLGIFQSEIRVVSVWCRVKIWHGFEVYSQFSGPKWHREWFRVIFEYSDANSMK